MWGFVEMLLVKHMRSCPCKTFTEMLTSLDLKSGDSLFFTTPHPRNLMNPTPLPTLDKYGND